MSIAVQTKDMRQFGIHLFDQWTAMWNGDLGLADQIMASEFRLRYAQAGTDAFDNVRHPQQLADTIATWHQTHPGLSFSAEGEAVVDLALTDGTAMGSVGRPYLASYTGETVQTIARSGIDILKVIGGLITEVWSVSGGVGGRTFYR